jgi:ubiquinone/menaquinone biosynthesis C-methylase UbiE
MTDHFQQIYASHADAYEALVVREDYQGNILKALQSIHPLTGRRVVEFGAGTGRLTLLLAPFVRHLFAFDASAHMLEVTRAKVAAQGFSNVHIEVADNRSLPVPSASADLAIEGWSFAHAVGWYPDSWKQEISRMLAEIDRVLRPGGTAVLMETLGTGREDPQPPNSGLAECYAWLESEHGFTRQSIRTDYHFESLHEAEKLTRFFFGDELADEVVRRNWVVLPECTGIWHRARSA